MAMASVAVQLLCYQEFVLASALIKLDAESYIPVVGKSAGASGSARLDRKPQPLS
jgi:hypothetical protein